MIGLTFGQLTVIARVEDSATHRARYKTRCSCGATSIVQGAALRAGATLRCRVCAYKVRGAKKRTHGMSKHPARAVWNTMRQRCSNSQNDCYPYYGGRGIRVDPRWEDFAAFWQDMGPTYRAGLTLDRRDNDGPYTKNNCRWVSRTTQMRNTRRNRLIETPVGSLLLCEAVTVSDLHRATIVSRIKRNWPASRLFEPARVGSKT